MLTMPSFKASLIVEQFQGNYLNKSKHSQLTLFIFCVSCFQPDLCTSEEGVAEYKGSPFVTSTGHVTASLKNAQISWRLFVENPIKWWSRLWQSVDSRHCRLNLIAARCLVSYLYISFFFVIRCDEIYIFLFSRNLIAVYVKQGTHNLSCHMSGVV